MSLKLEIVTPVGKALDVRVDSVTAPGQAGEFTVLPEHRPGVVLLSGGAIRYEGPDSGTIIVSGGVAEVGPDHVLVLADDAVLPANVDRAAAQALLDASAQKLASAEFLDDERLGAVERSRAYAEAMLRGAVH
ncbi:MAG: ATP synthase F1 subunit epsilon [Bradymonadia bacterium]|jgi:F-type H+-transporting ATPase subunit epsilon